MFDSEVHGLNVSIDKAFSATLRYASRQWAKHLDRAVPAENDTDALLCGLKDFLDNKLEMVKIYITAFKQTNLNMLSGKEMA